jgi:hypothetical protein
MKSSNNIIDVEINDEYTFVLLRNHKLKIFDIKTNDLVKEIEVKADQIKLFPARYIGLFNSQSFIMVLYDNINFEKQQELNFVKLVRPGCKLSRDKTKFVSFYDSRSLFCYNLDI